MRSQFRIVELFSGIGSQAQALRNIGAIINVVATCEWDIHAIVAYDAIHNRTDKIEPEFVDLNSDQLNEKLFSFSVSADGKKQMSRSQVNEISNDCKRRILSAIKRTNNYVNIQKVKGTDFPAKIDIMTYSFPCQDLSNVGALHGYKNGIARNAGNRSCMLWEVERLLKERKEIGMQLPKFLVMENVPALLSKRHRGNFEEWINVLSELGYHSKYFCLNAFHFGCPQNRYRLIMISIYIGNRKEIASRLDDYYKTHNLECPEYQKSLNIKRTSLLSCLHLDYTVEQYYLEGLQCQPNDTPSREKIWNDNLKIVGANNNLLTDHVATITTKQDRHPNSGNIFFNPPNTKSRYRFLTPRECFQIMGFREEDYSFLVSHDCNPNPKYTLFSRDKVHRLAGNSIPVKLLESIFCMILDIHNKGLARIYTSSKKSGNIKEVLREMGIRFKMFDSSLPGTPDFAIYKTRTIIQVRDCVMHHHEQCTSLVYSSVRRNFAPKLIKRNIKQDSDIDSKLRSMGWNVVVLWKCEIENGTYIEKITNAMISP